MEELENTLENWINVIISKPTEFLNEFYLDEDILRKELESLPTLKFNNDPAISNSVSEILLNQLHQKIRYQLCELAIWDTVLFFLGHPLPIPIANDLIDRGTSIISMSFTRQFDEIQWRLATLFEDAFYILLVERYTEDRYTASQFEIMLKLYDSRYPNLIYILSFCTSSSPQKHKIFLDAAKDYTKESNYRLRKKVALWKRGWPFFNGLVR